jgi:hypothetical protein
MRFIALYQDFAANLRDKNKAAGVRQYFSNLLVFSD